MSSVFLAATEDAINKQGEAVRYSMYRHRGDFFTSEIVKEYNLNALYIDYRVSLHFNGAVTSMLNKMNKDELTFTQQEALDAIRRESSLTVYFSIRNPYFLSEDDVENIVYRKDKTYLYAKHLPYFQDVFTHEITAILAREAGYLVFTNYKTDMIH